MARKLSVFSSSCDSVLCCQCSSQLKSKNVSVLTTLSTRDLVWLVSSDPSVTVSIPLFACAIL